MHPDRGELRKEQFRCNPAGTDAFPHVSVLRLRDATSMTQCLAQMPWCPSSMLGLSGLLSSIGMVHSMKKAECVCV